MKTTTLSPWFSLFPLTVLRWIFFGSCIGLAAGSTTAFLIFTNDLMTDTRNQVHWLLYLLPVGGAFIGAMYRYLGNGSRAGNDLILEYIHGHDKRVPLQMGPIVYIGTFISHLLGGSTGREGAAIQMAGSITEGINRLFSIKGIDRRILLIAGISGGFGAAFGTPVTGAVFGMEVVAVGRMRYDAIIPCVTSSIIGHLVTMTWGVKHEHHTIEKIPELTYGAGGKVLLAAILFGLISMLYSQLRHSIHQFCKVYIPNLILRGFLGGSVIVALVYIIGGSRDYLGRGLPLIDQAFTGSVSPLAFLYKIIFTAVTMGTGFRGGEVIPLFFVGSTLGNVLAPFLDLPVSFLAALGLIGVFCGAAQAPIACFLLSMEMFEGQGTLYFFLVCIVSYLFSGHHGIYPTQSIYEPKSRLFRIPDGQTITATEGNTNPWDSDKSKA